MTVTEAIKRRISTREFRPDPVSRELVEEILEVARWAPSGGNLQPWRVIVLAGAERQEIIRMAKQNFESAPTNGEGDRPIYPQNLWEPYRTRRFKVGEDMYARLGPTSNVSVDRGTPSPSLCAQQVRSPLRSQPPVWR